MIRPLAIICAVAVIASPRFAAASGGETVQCGRYFSIVDDFASGAGPARPLARPLRVVIVTDAWNQINGVVKHLEGVRDGLAARGHEVMVLHPESLDSEGRPMFRTWPLVGYPAVRAAYAAILPWNRTKIVQAVRAFAPDHLHVSTEGPLGWAARAAARDAGWRFSSAYHTRYPEYLRVQFGLPESLSYAVMRAFHGAADNTMYSLERMRRSLIERGFNPDRLSPWTAPFDSRREGRDERARADLASGQGSLFAVVGERLSPSELGSWSDPNAVVLGYLGRVTPQKSVEDFLSLPTARIARETGKRVVKVVVGPGPGAASLQDGDPYLARLKRRFPEAIFVGAVPPALAASVFSTFDVFVFPSRTETLGHVVLESFGAGVPVAAYDAPGPGDLIRNGVTGFVGPDLEDGVLRSLRLVRTGGAAARAAIMSAAGSFPRDEFVDEFLYGLVPIAGATDGSDPR